MTVNIHDPCLRLHLKNSYSGCDIGDDRLVVLKKKS